MNLIFMGTPEFAVPSLDILVQHGYVPVAVVTAPDRPRGRGQEVTPTPVKSYSQLRGIQVLQPESLRDPAFSAAIQEFAPDLLVVVAFRILPREIFSIPRRGAFNLHASLLPKYRGAAPINWAIIRGEHETGVTTFFLEEKVDTGAVILQQRVPILADDDAGVLHDRLAQVGADVVLKTVRLIEEGRAVPQLQDSTLSSPAPKIFRDQCRIDWAQPAIAVHNFVRGLAPVPAAFTTVEGKVLKIQRTQVTSVPSSAPPGTLVVRTDGVNVATGDGELSIVELQLEGRKRMGISEFLRGNRMTSGMVLQ